MRVYLQSSRGYMRRVSSNRWSRAWATLMFSGLLLLLGVVPAAHAQKDGGTLTMVVQPEPPTLALYMSTANPAGVVGSKIYEGLLRYDFNLNPLPNLAQSWEIAPDGKEITFHLAKGVKFHDGTEFTSADVQYVVMEVMKKRHPRGQVTFSDVVAVDTPDPYTAIFRLRNPAPYLMRALSGYESPMAPKHLLEKTDLDSNELANNPVGTGPYKFVEWEKGQYIRLEKNENYWKEGLPHLDGIVMRFIGDAATRVAAIERGEIDYGALSAVPNIDVARVEALPEIEATTKGYEVLNPIVHVELNTRREPLDNVKVRQALAYAIDRQFVVDNIWYGFGQPATGPIHSNLTDIGLYTTEGVRNYNVPNGPEIANKLLDEAGLEPNDEGVRFEITLDILPFGAEWQRLGEYLQQAWRKIGVRLNLRYEDFATYLRRIYTDYDFDMSSNVLFTQPDPVMGVHRMYHSKWEEPGTIFIIASGWSSPETDRLMDEATIENDPERRAELYHELQRKLTEAAPIIHINELDWVTVYNNRFENLVISPLGVLSSFEQVYLRE